MEGRRLEPRLVLSSPKAIINENQFLLTHPQAGFAYKLGNPPFLKGSKAFPFHGPKYNQGYPKFQTIRGGQGLYVAMPDGSRFRVTIQYADAQSPSGLLSPLTGSTGANVIPGSVVQPNGTVRGYAMPGGKVGLIVDGTNVNSQLVVDPLPVTQRKGYAHSFGYGETGRTHVLNVGSLNVTSGQLSAVLGFHSVDLSGPLVIGGGSTVDRIALDSIQPGGAIGTGGTVNTLDIAQGINMTSGPGITIGGDLNLFNVGQSVNLAGGASIVVGRFAGLTPQPPKGTGNGSNILSLNQSTVGTGSVVSVTPSVSAYIQGNLTIAAGSVFRLGSGIANSSILTTGGSASPVLVNGTLNVASGTYNSSTAILTSDQVQIPNLVLFNSFAVGVNFVARNGLIINGTTALVPA
jgi:hypothetical protein